MLVISRLLILVFLTLLIASPVAAKKILKISAPPSIWVQEDGDKITGPIVDILSEIFTRVGVEIVAKKLPWARAIEHMKSGHLDLMPVIFYTPEREKSMAFSIPYVEVPTVVFVAKGKIFPFKQLEDLVGRRGLFIRNDSISPEFHSFKSNLNLTQVSDYNTILKMLNAGRADYAVCAKYGFLIEAKRLGYEQKMESLQVPVASRSLHIAISKKSPFLDYLPEINSRFKAMHADGTMKIMVDKVLNHAAGK